MKTLIYIIIIASALATFIASAEERQKREFRPLIPGQFTSASILAKALAWEGRSYRPGVSAQCANWVGHVVCSAGGSTPVGHSMARNWLKWGHPVSRTTVKPGDIVVTWRGSRSGRYGHILIYVGDGLCIHRPTRSKPVEKVPLSTFSNKILGIRRK